jgi:hypothetical protein
MGVFETITRRLESLKKNTAPTQERNTFGITGTELMVIKDKAVDQRVSRLFPHVKTSTRAASMVEGNAYRQGQADGHNVSLHRSVNGDSSVPIGIGR